MCSPMTRPRSSRLGYDGERPVEVYLREHINPNCYRPRAGATIDVGDILGLPITVSCKNHTRLSLAEWVVALQRMVRASGLEAGVVWHKRRGKSSPEDWYVTTTGGLFLPMLKAYVEVCDGGVAMPGE